MSKLSCNACENLRENAPELMIDGLTSDEITSLKNNTGLNPSAGSDDCADLNDMNDCLVGTFATGLEHYDMCDWKTFMRRLMPNLWTTLKAIIASICGLWKMVEIATSYRLTKSGNKITLTASDGEHGSVTDSDTQYELTKSGNQITLSANGQSHGTVTDKDTTYGLSISGHTLSIVAGGTTTSVTLPDGGGGGGGGTDTNTTYTMTLTGSTLELVGSDGSTSTVVLPTEGGGGGVSRIVWKLDDSVSVPDTDSGGNPDYLTFNNILTLTEGIWIVVGSIGFAANGIGLRGMGLGLNGSSIGVQSPAVTGGFHSTLLTKTYTFVVPAGGANLTMAYRQTSGGNLNIMAYPTTYVTAVKVA